MPSASDDLAYSLDPVLWAEEVLGYHPDPWQADPWQSDELFHVIAGLYALVAGRFVEVNMTDAGGDAL